MKLKVKIQQVIVAQNCWRTDATPKLPQRETESSIDVDVDNIDLEISSLWLHEAYLVSENVWRTKKSKLEKHNINAADGIIIQTCLNLSSFLLLGRFHCNIDVCLFQVVMTHCFGKLTHADICQRGGDFNT